MFDELFKNDLASNCVQAKNDAKRNAIGNQNIYIQCSRVNIIIYNYVQRDVYS